MILPFWSFWLLWTMTDMPYYHNTTQEDLYLNELQARLNHARKVCKYYGFGSTDHHPNAWEFLISKQHKMIWCNVFKAGSSSWLYLFNILGGYTPESLNSAQVSPVELARRIYPRPSIKELTEAFENSFSFMIVREPFQRLLSAYRNKIEKSGDTFYKKTAEFIVKNYRKTKDGATGPIFSEFIDYIIDVYENGKEIDPHWARYYEFCTPCQVNFSVIAKTETMKSDQKYILEAFNTNKVLKMQKINQAKDGRNTSDLIEEYYSQLSIDQVTRLYSIFHIDFEMFQYDASKYFNLHNITFDKRRVFAAENQINSVKKIFCNFFMTCSDESFVKIFIER